MSEELLRQYDSIASLVARFTSYEHLVKQRVILPNYKLKSMFEEYDGFRLFRLAWRVYREIDYSRLRQNPAFVELGATLPEPEDKEQATFHRIVFSEYPLAALGAFVREQHPNADFQMLASLHKATSTRLPKLNFRGKIGFAFGFGTFVAKTVPESVVSRYVEWKEFEAWAFYLSVGFAAYLAALLLPTLYKVDKAEGLNNCIGDTLEYLAICTKKTSE